jgi:hypothetical protein
MIYGLQFVLPVLFCPRLVAQTSVCDSGRNKHRLKSVLP